MIRSACRSLVRAVIPGTSAVRRYRILAIESSCDDSCIALLEKKDDELAPRVIEQSKRTLNSIKEGGIIPTQAHEFHQQALGDIAADLCERYGLYGKDAPELICCTRGPGMVGSLSAGLQLAKGLAVAWNRPLVGVHHMLAHILVANISENGYGEPPQYPFLSLLCSGGHTMLVLSSSLTQHDIIVDTADIAVGDSIDKCSRELRLRGNMLGKELERYVESIPEQSKQKFKERKGRGEGSPLYFSMPFRGPKHGKIPDVIQFSFASFLSSLTSYTKTNTMTEADREYCAYKLQESVFDHIVDRVNVALRKNGISIDGSNGKFIGVKDFICSGGVASNKVLRQKLVSDLQCKEFLGNELRFHYPDPSLCSDNAIMIGVAGMEIYDKLQKRSSLDISPIRKWPLNELLSVSGWVERN